MNTSGILRCLAPILTGAAALWPIAALATDPQSDLELQDWLVLVCDSNRPTASERRMFESTLPSFVGGRRSLREGDAALKPSAVGVIRLSKPPGSSTDRFDVLLERKGGSA